MGWVDGLPGERWVLVSGRSAAAPGWLERRPAAPAAAGAAGARSAPRAARPPACALPPTTDPCLPGLLPPTSNPRQAQEGDEEAESSGAAVDAEAVKARKAALSKKKGGKSSASSAAAAKAAEAAKARAKAQKGKDKSHYNQMPTR